MKKVYFVLLTSAAAWRINKPNLAMRFLCRLFAWEIYSIENKANPDPGWGILITEWGLIKRTINMQFNIKEITNEEKETQPPQTHCAKNHKA